MTTHRVPGRIDQSALKVNQAFIIGTATAAFILGQPLLVLLLAAIMLLGAAVPPLSLFKQIYFRVLRPADLVQPNVIADEAAPHRFAQGFGGAVLLAAALLLWVGTPLAGWVLTWLVIALAALNLLFGFCAGCFLYYQLRRRGVPGFSPAME